VAGLVGAEVASSVSKAAVALYTKAAEHAESRGIILADTKFEFGLLDKSQLILVDEVLTPDSSRFWDAKSYKAGQAQASFDKQYVRDWLKSNKLDKAADEGVPVTLPEDVVRKTSEKYQEAFERITGQEWKA
jgi:phosphoribosylaminoimidazole-succinocarboxamide synthase